MTTTGEAAFGQIVLVLQGGGALGAYQAGVYEALHEAGLEPDWVIGTSIGAINSALIAGSPIERRLERLRAFWSDLDNMAGLLRPLTPFTGSLAAASVTAMGGVHGFFAPNPYAWLGPQARLGPELASYYSTAPLARTLERMVDFDVVAAGRPRLTVGAADVGEGKMVYFDSRESRLDVRHVLASCALPPAFAAVRIDGRLYWDGGVLSNTPVEAVFDDNPRRSGLVFAVHIWNPQGAEPDTLWKVVSRQKDLLYASRAAAHIARQQQIHKLRHVIAELEARLPAGLRDDPEVRRLSAYGCMTRMHVMRLLAPPLEGEDHAKDIDFDPARIRQRWASGLADTRKVLARRPWGDPVPTDEGFVLHEAAAGREVATV